VSQRDPGTALGALDAALVQSLRQAMLKDGMLAPTPEVSDFLKAQREDAVRPTYRSGSGQTQPGWQLTRFIR
jgi:hypothetical protein